MFKKICASITLSCLPMLVFGMPLDELNDQLITLQTQIKKVKLSWQKAEVTLIQAKKISPTLFHEAQSAPKNIIAKTSVIATMTTMVNQQAADIIKSKKAYEVSNFLAIKFPSLIPAIQPTDTPQQTTAKKYLAAVLAATVNKQFRLLLLKKLVDQEKKLMIAIETAKTNVE